jgi:hypothetical protein
VQASGRRPEVGTEPFFRACKGASRASPAGFSRAFVITLDCRLRIKQNVPIEAGEHDIEFTRVGVEAEKDSTEPNAVQYHKQLLLPNEPMLLVQQLHDVCKTEKCSLWDGTLEHAFQELDTVVEAQAIVDLASGEEFVEQRSGGEMSLEEMERLLSGL